MLILLILTLFLSAVSGQLWRELSDNSETSAVKEEQIGERQDIIFDVNKNNIPSVKSCLSRRSYNDDNVEVPSPPLEWRPVFPITTDKKSPDVKPCNQVTTIPVPPTTVPPSPQQPKHNSSQNVEEGDFDAYTNQILRYLSKDTKPNNNQAVESGSRSMTKQAEIESDDQSCALYKELGLYGDSSGRRFLSPEATRREELILKLHNKLNVNTDAKNAKELGFSKTIYQASGNNVDGANKNAYLLPLGNGRINILKPKSFVTDKNQLLEPTKGIGIVPLSNTKLRTLDNSRVCYACSTISDPSCWNPDRKTTVKYCRQGRDFCVKRFYNNSLDASLVVIRDCSSTCDSVPIGNLKYLSCEICTGDLCNDQEVYNNSSYKNFNIMLTLICIVTGLIKSIV